MTRGSLLGGCPIVVPPQPPPQILGLTDACALGVPRRDNQVDMSMPTNGQIDIDRSVGVAAH